MDRRLHKFILLFGLVFLATFLGVGALYFVYDRSSIRLYNHLQFMVLILAVALFLFLLLCALVLVYTYRKKSVGPLAARATFFCALMVRPSVIWISRVLKLNTEDLLQFFIEINNIITHSRGMRFHPGDVLVILPHCLQFHDCKCKVTGGAENCKKCGQCEIGPLETLCAEKGVRLEVVSGGTAARNAVKRLRPKLIISVACERDLFSGIVDVGSIPVYAIVNDRPHGPCLDTSVDLAVVREKIDRVLV